MREGWKNIKLKYTLQIPLMYGLNEPAENDNPEDPRYIRITDFDENENLRIETYKSIPLVKAQNYLLRANDILFARSGATVGKSFLYKSSDGLACFAGYLIRARFIEKAVSPLFFSYITKSYYYDQWKNRVNIQSTIQNISAEKYNQFEFLLPPLPEQTAIANSLDKKTTWIANQITLLEKKRDTYLRLKKSLINKVVAKGLNPNVEFKDSGINWLGKIPKHWVVKRVKDIGYMFSGLSGKSGDDFRNEDDSKNKHFIPYTNILNNLYLNPSLVKSVVIEEGEKQNKIRKGDLFFLMSSEDYESIGKTSVLNENVSEIYLNSFCKGVRITEKNVYPPFINYQLLSDKFRDGLRFEARGFTRINLKIDKVMSMTVCVPPLSEQQEIANYLDLQSEKIDAIVSNINTQILKMRTLRKSLINEVVTGERSIV
jgi:type I restriction enzyme S subunit